MLGRLDCISNIPFTLFSFHAVCLFTSSQYVMPTLRHANITSRQHDVMTSRQHDVMPTLRHANITSRQHDVMPILHHANMASCQHGVMPTCTHISGFVRFHCCILIVCHRTLLAKKTATVLVSNCEFATCLSPLSQSCIYLRCSHSKCCRALSVVDSLTQRQRTLHVGPYSLE